MAGQTWSINIISGSSGTSFVPDVYTETPPTSNALQAQTNDVISWNNQTDQVHQPWQTDSTFVIGTSPNTPLCDPVPAFGSSSPGYNAVAATTPGTIYYACKEQGHEQEHGTIDVVA